MQPYMSPDTYGATPPSTKASRKARSNHSNCEHKVRVRNSTYDALKALSQAENKAMSVIIDQLVQERVIGAPYSVPTSQRSTPDGKRAATRGRRSAIYYDDALPDDVLGLQELVATLQAELQEARAELDRTHQDNAHLQAEYTTLWNQVHHVCYLSGTSVEQFFASGTAGQPMTHELHLDGSLTYTGEQRLSPHSLDGASGNAEDRTSPSSKQPQLHSGVSGSHEDIWAGLVHHEPVAVPVTAVVAVPEGATSALRDAIKQGGFDICLTAVSSETVGASA